MLHMDLREGFYSAVGSIGPTTLHPVSPLRSPFRRFVWLAEIRPRPLDLAVLQFEYVADIHAVAIVLEDHLSDTEVSADLYAIVDHGRQAAGIVLGNHS